MLSSESFSLHFRALTTQVSSLEEKTRSLRIPSHVVGWPFSFSREKLGLLVLSSSAPSANGHVDFATDVQTIEKFLTAVDRLRGERDELRRQLEFMQVESKFTWKPSNPR